MEEIAVLGAGSWGTALAVTLAKKGFSIKLWARRAEQAEKINKIKENVQYLPGVVIPYNIICMTDLEKALHNCNYIVLSVPTHGLRDLAKQIKDFIKPADILINTAKGIEPNTLMLMSEILEQEIPDISSRLAVLSGPSHAEEVGKEQPTAVVVASKKEDTATKVQDLFITPKFRVYTNSDIVGVEIGGALKNVIALATGISDGLGFGDNAKAGLITRGITEIARLGIKMGARPSTFAGLTGIGDLVVTCTSMHSRNRRAGIAIGKGKNLAEILNSMGMVVEGVRTAKAAALLCKKYEVDLPISLEVYNVLFRGIKPEEAVIRLMTRVKKHEVEDIQGW